MTDHFFDHDRLDVYRLSIEYVAKAFDTSRSLEGLQIKIGTDRRDIDSDGDEIRWCLGITEGVQSVRRLRARAPSCRTEHEHEKQPERNHAPKWPVGGA